MSRTRRATANYATALAFTAVTMLTGFVATRYLVPWLGEERFGAARAITDLYGFLALLELGLGAAMGPLLARALGRGDEAALRRTVAAGVRAYLKLTPLVLGVGLAVTALLPWLIKVDPALRGELRLAWLLGLVGWAALPLSPLRSLVEAEQRGYRLNLLLTAQGVLVAAASLALAWAGAGLIGQASALLAGSLAVTFALTRDGLRRHPGLASALRHAGPDPEARREIRALSGPSLAFQVSSRLGLLSDNLVVTAMLGARGATTLVLTQRLATLIQMQLQNVGTACWAGLAELHARGERDLFNRRLVELTRLVAVLGVAALAPMVAFNRPFVALWMRGRGGYGGDLVAAVAAADALVLALVSLWGWCFGGTGRIGRIAGPTCATMAANLALSVLLTRWTGHLAGPLLGTLLAYLGGTLWWLPLRLRADFGVSVRALAAAAGWPLLWGLPYAAGLWWLARLYPPAGWIALIAATGGSAAAFLAFSALALLSPTDRALWRARLAALLPRRRARAPVA